MSEQPAERSATPKEEPPPQNQDVQDLQDQFAQQQAILSQLREALRNTEDRNTTKEKEAEVVASRLSDIKSRTSTRLSPRTGKPDEARKGAAGGEATHSKLSVLRQKVSENRAIFEQRGREKEETKRGVEVMVEQLRAQLSAKDDTIRVLQENIESTIASRHLAVPTSELHSEESAEEVKVRTAEYEQKIADLSSQVFELQSTIVGLQENLLEKDSVIDARTKAISLMSEDLCRKGKTTLDQLEDTREEMRQMQNTFATFEAGMNSKQEETMKDLMIKDERIREVEMWNNQLISENSQLTTRVSELQEKVTLVEQQSATKAGEQDDSEELRKALCEANKQIIKLKAQNKKQVKQLNSLKKGAETESDGQFVDLQNKIAELEEEKGNFQLHMVDFDELKVSELHLQECISQLNAHISSLEEQGIKQAEELAIKEDLEKRLDQNYAEMRELQEEIHQVREMKVQAELKAVELEESMDNIIKEKNIMADNLKTLQEKARESQTDKETMTSLVEEEILDGKDNRDELIADLNARLNAQNSKYDSLYMLLSSVFGDGSPEDWVQHFISDREALSKSIDSKSRDESHLYDLQMKLHERDQELDSLKSEQIKNSAVIKELTENLTCMESALLQRDTEIQEANTKSTKLNEKFKKVAANLKAKALQSKTLNEDLQRLQSDNVQYTKYIAQLKAELDEITTTLEGERRQVTDGEHELTRLQEQLMDMNTTLSQEQSARHEFEVQSTQNLASLQQDFERTQLLQDQELNDANLTISHLNEKTSMCANQIDTFAASLHEKDIHIQSIEKELRETKEMYDECLTNLSSKVAAMCAQLRNWQHQIHVILTDVSRLNFPGSDPGFEIVDILQDIVFENLAQVSESLDAVLAKTVHQINLLGYYLSNKSEVIKELTKQNCSLQEELQHTAAVAHQTYSTAFAKLQAELEDLHYSTTRYKERVSELESEQQEQQARINDNNTDATELRRTLTEYSQSVAECTQQITELQANIADLQHRNESLAEENRNDNARLGTTESALLELQERIALSDQTLSDNSNQMRVVEEQHLTATESFTLAMEQLKQEYIQLEERYYHLEEEKLSIQGRFRSAGTIYKETSDKNLELEKEVQELKDKLHVTQEEVNTLTLSRCAELNKLETEKEGIRNEIAAIKHEQSLELERCKDLENQLTSLQQSSDATISELVKKAENLKKLVARVDEFKHLCDKDVSDIISQSQAHIEEVQGAAPLPVAEVVIIPAVSTGHDVSQGVDETWQDQLDEGWGWGSDEAQLEEAHQATSQQSDSVMDLSNAELKRQLTDLEVTVNILDEEKAKLSSELKVAQVRSGKLIKKLKELKSLNDQLSKKSAENSNSLDHTMEMEFQLKITSLETQLSDLKSEKAQTIQDNEMLKNRLAALEWQMSDLTDDNAKMSKVIRWSEQNILEKESKISELVLTANEMVEQRESLERSLAKLHHEILAAQPFDHQNSSPTAVESSQDYSNLHTLCKEHEAKINELLETQAVLELRCQEQATLDKLYQKNLTDLEELRDVHEELKTVCNQTEIDLCSVQDAHNKLSSVYRDNQEKLTAVLAELEACKLQLQSQEHFNSLQQQLAQLTEENQLLRDLVDVKETEIGEIRKQLTEMSARDHSISSSKTAQLTEENELLRDLLSVRNTEVDEIRQQLQTLTQDRSNTLQNQLTQLTEENQLLRDLVDVKETELKENRQHSQTTNQEPSNMLQIHLAQLTEDNQLLRDVSDVKDTELRETRQYLTELSTSDPYQSLQNQLSHLTEENQMLKDMLSRRDVEVNMIRQQLQNRLAQSTEEIQSLRDLVDVKETELRQIHQQLQLLTQNSSSEVLQSQLAQSVKENQLLRDLDYERKNEIIEIRQQLTEIEMKCSETVDQERLELENMKNVLSANEVQAVQYVQEINNLRTALLKQSSEIEHLKEDLLRRLQDIDLVSDELNETERKYSDLRDLHSTKDQDMSKLKSRLELKDSQLEDVTKELQEHQQVIKLLRSVHESEKKAENLSQTMAQPGPDSSDDSFVSQSDHNLALYSWHQQEMRVNEMSLELMQLMEERDTLQLRLSRSLRTIEELRKLNETLASHSTTESIASVLDTSLEQRVGHRGHHDAIIEGEEQLATKLDQVRSVGRQQRQMALQQHGGVAIDASYTVSRDAQSQSETMLNWLFGKSTPKVVHI